MAKMLIPQPWFRSREHYEAVRDLVTDEPLLLDTFDQWLEAANQRVEKIIASGRDVKKVFIDPKEFAAWRLTPNVGHNREGLLAFTIFASTKQ